MARSIYTEQEAQFLKNIGYRVQFFRKKAGLSQEELSLIHISEPTRP